MAKANPKNFIYVEYASSKIHSNEIIQVEGVPALVESNGIDEQFMSKYYYRSTTGHLLGPVFAHMYFDFDSEKDQVRAQAETLSLVEYCLNAGVDEDYIKIRFTGNKGFSVEVPAAYFGAFPHVRLNLYYKEVAKTLKREHGLKTLDLSVYDRRRMWRITGTKHAKTRLFKVPLTVDMLQHWTIDEVREYAAEAHPYKLLNDLDPILNKLPPIYPLETLLFKKSKKKVDKLARDNQKKFEKRIDEDYDFDENKVFSCVKHLINYGITTSEYGFRREPTGFTIAAALKGLNAPDEYIIDQLQTYFENCTPPMNVLRVEREIPNIIKQVNRTDYATHCQTPCFDFVCKANKLKETCWIFNKDEEAEPEVKREEFTEEVKQAALMLLTTDEILEYIQESLGDVVGEDTTKVALFLLQLVEESCRISGETSTGKSYMTDIVLECFPKHWIKIITGVSDKAIRYIPDFIRTIYFKEFAKGSAGGKGDSESTAEYDMKLLMSEGKLTTMLVEKVDGKLTQTEREVVINNFISTSTDVQMAPELRNRQWELATNRRLNMPVVHDALLQNALPSDERRDLGPSRQVLRYAIEILDQECPKRYVIPYAPILSSIFEPLSENARIRRDVRKLMKLIYASARLHYKQRPVLNSGEIVCLPEDFLNAWTYGEDALMGTFTEMTIRMKEVWGAICKMDELKKKLTAPAVASVVNISRQKAGDWLRRFTNENLLQIKGRDGKGIEYVKVGTESAGNTEVHIDMLKMTKITSRFLKRYGAPKTKLAKLNDITVVIPVLSKVKIDDLEDAEQAIIGGLLGSGMNPWQLQIIKVLGEPSNSNENG